MDNNTSNPTVPIGYDIAWGISAILWLALTVVALLSVLRSTTLRWESKICWCAIIAILPIFGAAAWFIFGDRPSHVK
ncbi:PLD nuclease N-terminal domain-containing protein [Rhodococcus sp. IEGM 1379]|uniref:PLD nuclease N-terminal domain-containing protein n=1 Tax=Rhodococcus sp. IEGM 1379 TaxID=3047086 RepID=UPI0024B7F26E|nr:PLD nuclease N-terminal domain-containing protein [Rhodococcus sp. IEGM 1379]MDI9914714.1 PLD nuclease N-terminal domain-containing protein [Rhodococcus sp. IEGM 1379]